jgi:predicted TIM-barrel fold metal-dependent hydrolase
MIIDTHVHVIKPFDSKGNRQVYSPNPCSAEDYVALMDASDIDRAFYISWSPEDIPSDLTVKSIAMESVRETMCREYALEVLARYPDRFYWFPCHLGPTLPDYFAMARENLEMGAAGLKFVYSFWGEMPGDERLIPLYDLARDYRAQVIIDTSYWYLGKEDRLIDPDDLQEGHREVAKRITDFADYARHLRAVFSAYPTINFSLAHAGARNFTVERAREVGMLMRDYPNVYADLGALDVAHPMLDALVETAGPDRIMFGTDYPHFAQGPVMRQLLDQVRRPGRFASSVADRILGENALAFVGGKKPGLQTQ